MQEDTRLRVGVNKKKLTFIRQTKVSAPCFLFVCLFVLMMNFNLQLPVLLPSKYKTCKEKIVRKKYLIMRLSYIYVNSSILNLFLIFLSGIFTSFFMSVSKNYIV